MKNLHRAERAWGAETSSNKVLAAADQRTGPEKLERKVMIETHRISYMAMPLYACDKSTLCVPTLKHQRALNSIGKNSTGVLSRLT